MILSRVHPMPVSNGGLFFEDRMNYRTMLIEAHQRHQALDLPAPMSWLDHKNAMNLKAWRERLAVAAREG